MIRKVTISFLRLMPLLLLGLLASDALAQTAGGSIAGTVKDPSGASIPDTTTVIRNVATGVARTVLSNEVGVYRAPNLQPGTYELTVSAPGFQQQIRKDLTLNVGSELVIDFALEIGSVTEAVEVTSQGAEIDLSSATVSKTVVGSTIRELPLNGRDWTQLSLLEPGISAIGGSGGSGRGGNGKKLTVSGARPSENNFRLDGISLNDSSNSTPGNTIGTNLGVESVREFSIVSNNYSAEYGRATGAVINAVTRSGTNDIHGTLFYFHRNSDLDARNFFDGATKPSFRRHQFGAAVGGPIIKNRTFWFANYEDLRQTLATTSIANTLSATARAGQLSTGTVAVDPRIARMFPLLPLPNGPLLGTGETGQYFSQINDVSQGKYILGKIDHQLSDRFTLSGSYLFDDADSNSPDVFHTKTNDSLSSRHAAMTELTGLLTPSLMSVTRLGFSRTNNVDSVLKDILNPLLEDPSLGFLPGRNIGATSVTGITVPGSGPGSDNTNIYVFNSYQAHQNFYISHGVHAFKTGTSVERMQYNYDSPNRNGGDFQFGSISDFLTNRPTSFAALFDGSDTRRGLRQTLLAGYFQDDIRVRSSFSLNIGVRYEFLTIPTEVNGKVALLQNLTDAEVRVGGPIHDSNATTMNFAPRIGLVWDPFKSGKTSIRSSFGVFDSLPLLWLYDTPLARSAPFFVQGVSTNLPQGSFPDQAYPLIQAGALRTAYVDVDPARGYSMKWNLSIQRQFGSLVTEVGYTGSRGTHLPIVERNMNARLPINTPNGWVYDPNSTVLNPNFASINTTDTWNADSIYHGLQVSVRRTIGDGLQVVGSYAWSKSQDSTSSTGSTAANSGYSGASALAHPLIPGLNWGLSEFDLRHNLTLSMVWELPFAKNSSGLSHALLHGWQLGTIYSTNTGNPFSVALAADRGGSGTDTTNAGLGQRPNLLQLPGCEKLTNPGNPNSYIKTECFAFPAASTLGNLGRNGLTKPGLSNLDLSIVRNFQITEKITTQLRGEVFNALNHANFGTPANVVFDRQGRVPANAGRITSVATDGRRIQVALKLNF